MSRGQVASALLALLIGYTSILSAVVAWRASLSSIDAGRLESLAVQEQARREQLLGEATGIDAEGRLEVRTPEGSRTLGVGDVVHVRPVS